MSSIPATAPATDGALTHKQILTILTGLMLGMFLAALDQTIVATAIRTIGDDLHGLSAQAWVTTAFLITSTIATPLYGKLSDIYGRKPLFMIAITIFLVGSALCGLAQNMYMLAVFRAFQGIGAGGLFSLALAILGDLVAPRERARYQGYFLAVFATSSVLGPVIGGFFAGQQSILGITGWRWIFYINVPIGLIALVVVNRTLHLHQERRSHRIDWFGATALIVGLVPLLIIAEQGRLWGWASPIAFACYLIGVAGIVSFVYVESRMGDDALIPLRLFRSRNFAVGSGQSIVIGVGLFGGIASIPLYLQIVKGASPTEAGLLILPMVAGIMAAAVISGQLTSRTGHYRVFPIIERVPGDRHAAPLHDRRPHPVVANRPVHGRIRRRPGPEHAVDHPGHAKCRTGARHGRGHVLRHVLPADGWRARHGGVPLHPVLGGAEQDRRAIPGGGRPSTNGLGRPQRHVEPQPAAVSRARTDPGWLL